MVKVGCSHSVGVKGEEGGGAEGEGWTAAGSPRSSAGKGTYCTSLGKVTDMAVCPRHLSPELHTSTKTKRRARRPRRQQGPSLPLSRRLLGKCMSSYHRAARLAEALFTADPQAHPKNLHFSIKLNNNTSILSCNPVFCTLRQ